MKTVFWNCSFRKRERNKRRSFVAHGRNVFSHLVCNITAIPFAFGGGIPMPYMMLAHIIWVFGKAIVKGYIHQIVRKGGGTYKESLS
jgi:hypothetical protein